MADTEFSEGFIAQTKKMIAELQAELAPYEDGSAEARGGHDDQRENTTLDRIVEIKREIAALETPSPDMENRCLEDSKASSALNATRTRLALRRSWGSWRRPRPGF